MPNIHFRLATAGDLADLCTLINATNRADHVPQVATVPELVEDIENFDDVQIAISDNDLVGYVRAMYLPSDQLWERCYLFGAVLPQQRGRGIGRNLMSWAVDRGITLLRSSNSDLPKFLRTEADEHREDARRLFQRLGFREVRQFEELLRPLTDLPPVSNPQGVRIAPWPTDRDDEIREVKNVAFADHWGSTPTSPAKWASWVRGYGSYLEHSYVALDDEDRVVGYALNHRYPADDALLGRRDGWIDNLGTLPAWRGRGVATALITQSMHGFASAGLTHASLGVDSDSLTGAVRLYKSLGFITNRRHSTLEIELPK